MDRRLGRRARSARPGEPFGQQPFLERLDGWLAEAEIAGSVRRVILERRDEMVRALACQNLSEAG